TSDPNSPFWQFSSQTAPGEWTFVNAGASAFRVHSGDIQAWSWTGSEVTLPAISIEELAERAGVDVSTIANSTALPAVALHTEGALASEEQDQSNNLV